MKTSIAATLLSALPSAYAWGALGHETVAYVASNFVTAETVTFAQKILGDTSSAYLANVATWADTYRYTSAGKFSEPYHFIDALDDPPTSCNVDYARDCGTGGCVVRAINNYVSRPAPTASSPPLTPQTARVQDSSLPASEVFTALKFIIHFIGDIHQPLHDENLDVGGNTVSVTFNGTATNLHAAWDTSIPQGYAGSASLPNAAAFAAKLTARITTGDLKSQAAGWLTNISLVDPVTTATGWAGDANAYVCSVVIPDGVAAVAGTDLAGDYYTSAIPVVELLLATAGYRLAAWLNLIATGSTGL